ncbi:hypothetical protein BDV18DRAFT_165983 [Aspergillus unguis]
MASWNESLSFNIVPLAWTGFSVAAILGLVISRLLSRPKNNQEPGRIQAFLLFCYCCFLKPHAGRESGGQQNALEGFYKRQAGVYDATRDRLLQGRREMLAMVAAQLRSKPKSERVWIDIGGGTGWCIEAMAAVVNVPDFFSHVYLVDLSPSLCEVARQRFRRLGWKNVHVVCEDARLFAPKQKASLITMVYSLSMIPDYYSTIESLTSLLADDGIMGVVDFYVQGRHDFEARSTDNQKNRHVNWLARTFWRAWFDLDHISLDSGRRDCLEFKLRTVLTLNARNKALGWIPYYIWLGSKSGHHNPRRADYTASLPKHTQFNDEYIYAFTWEDSRQDHQLLKLTADDVVLAITSAGDNILSYATKGPRIHAVDLNPAQNHLLELKMASYSALPYEDFWMLFGEGRHPRFRDLLFSHISPHLSPRAFQYWLEHAGTFEGLGLYDTGGSRHALRAIRWISRLFRCRGAIRQFLTAETLAKQAAIWQTLIRPVMLSPLLCKLVVSQKAFLWKALGVPRNQLAMIERDYRSGCSRAIWRYAIDTLDPVARQTHIVKDNPYYYVCMAGKYSRACHPEYLSPAAHDMLSRPGALDNISIHTDEIAEVLTRLGSETLTVAVLMDSMDWLDPQSEACTQQITRLKRAMKSGGRVLLRSAALRPWYIAKFESHGFSAECVGARTDGACIDRVNMYASCWVCTKVDI